VSETLPWWRESKAPLKRTSWYKNANDVRSPEFKPQSQHFLGARFCPKCFMDYLLNHLRSWVPTLLQVPSQRLRLSSKTLL
jgi:hypothetical protein